MKQSKQETDAALRQQTEIFWLLQLQFMARSSYSLQDLYNGLRHGGMYNRNAHTKKVEYLMGIDPYQWTEDDHYCLATHCALQLAGVEE